MKSIPGRSLIAESGFKDNKGLKDMINHLILMMTKKVSCKI